MRSILIALFALCSAVATLAQPVIKTGGIVNGASWSLAGELNSNIAQGSIFIICGSGLGPKTLVSATTFPLPTSKGLDGVTVSIATYPKATNAILLWVRDDYIAAVLPSTVPVGRNQLTVAYEGQTSQPESFTVIPSSIGILSQSSNGSGPGLITDATKTFANNDIRTILVTPTNSAKPGDTLVLWATGVGAVKWDESNTPPANPTNLQKTMNPIVYIGDQVVTPAFAGRSGCCAGMDQIQFTIPANVVTGCRVPIAVMVGDTVSNFVSAAIDPSGAACSDEFGFSSEDITAMASESESYGFASFLTQRTFGVTSVSPLNYNQELTQFVKLGAGSTGEVQSPRPSLLTCMVTQNVKYPSYLDPFTYGGTGLDAGPTVFVSWPPASGAFVAQSTTAPGEYPAQITETSGPPATYKFQGSGGKDVGPFVVTVPTNAVSHFTLGQRTGGARGSEPGGLTIYWTGGDPEGFVEITAYNAHSNSIGAPGIGFTCEAPTAPGHFYIPKAVTDGMFDGLTYFAITAWSAPVSFKAQGIDKGLAMFGWQIQANDTIF